MAAPKYEPIVLEKWTYEWSGLPHRLVVTRTGDLAVEVGLPYRAWVRKHVDGASPTLKSVVMGIQWEPCRDLDGHLPVFSTPRKSRKSTSRKER